MSFNNKKNNNLQEAPLGYWEEKSYMSIIPRNQSENLISEIFQRLENKGINILEKRELTEEAPGYMKISYEDEDYDRNGERLLCFDCVELLKDEEEL